MTDPLEQVREMRERIAEENKYAGIDFKSVGGYKLIDALEAILAMPKMIVDSSDDILIANGYNQCLSEVHAIIAGKVGVEG